MPTETFPITRRFDRITLPKGMFVAWYGGGDSQVSRVQTLGMGGVFIAATNTPPAGTNVRLVFEVPGGSVQAEGVVRNVSPDKGMGVEFTRVGTRDRMLLKILLRRLMQ